MKGRVTQTDIVYNYVTQKISAGELHPDQKINEVEICNDLDVSRTPVREALIILSSEGILKRSMHKGFSVNPLTEKSAEELYTIMGALDGLAASLACDNITESTLEEMDFTTQVIDLALKNRNEKMYYKEQERFHDYYIDLCGNDMLADMIHSLRRKLVKRRYDMDTEDMWYQVMSRTNEDHKEMLTLFRNHDKQGLRDLLENRHWLSSKAIWESFCN
ncbi:MAG: GntR family transcriptional regulator [Anaerovoracaceae bacterium]|jgi:DNA-binding GntR family transcriptional regulator